MGEFSDLIATSEGATRDALQRILDLALTEVPDAVEDLSYGTPALRYRGKPLVGVRVSAKHLSVFPFSPEVVAAVADDLSGYSLSKGTIRFTADRPLPDAVITRLVALRRTEIDG
ncbi:MAG TPA: DUF1801 domain-containing protein [Propionicimonas sp.]|nr:DUF1801 domain-containing protein [Propionicimonas sp.]